MTFAVDGMVELVPFRNKFILEWFWVETLKHIPCYNSSKEEVTF
jgi:hypothetical protein